MIHSLSRGCWAALTIAIATFTPACRGNAVGVPLYPHSEATRLPANQIAQVIGPIGTIDGRDVADLGGWFELLPGCHVVELDRRVAAGGTALSSAVYLSGEFANTTYALRTRAGARYVIRREVSEGLGGLGSTVRVDLSAREEDASGAATDLAPAKSAQDVKACRDWETTAPGR